MDFVKYISTPLGCAESDPLITRVKLTRGRLVGGRVYFPYGPAGCLHFLARIGIHQIFPFNTGENLRLDDCVFEFSIGIDLREPPFVIDLVTWNDSTTYDHALTVSLSLELGEDDGYLMRKLISDFAKDEAGAGRVRE